MSEVPKKINPKPQESDNNNPFETFNAGGQIVAKIDHLALCNQTESIHHVANLIGNLAPESFLKDRKECLNLLKRLKLEIAHMGSHPIENFPLPFMVKKSNS